MRYCYACVAESVVAGKARPLAELYGPNNVPGVVPGRCGRCDKESLVIPHPDMDGPVNG